MREPKEVVVKSELTHPHKDTHTCTEKKQQHIYHKKLVHSRKYMIQFFMEYL